MSVWRRLLDTVRALWPFEGEYWVEPSNAITRLVLAGPVPLSHIGLDDIGPFAQPAPAPQGAAATVAPEGVPAEQPAAPAAEKTARPGRAA